MKKKLVIITLMVCAVILGVSSFTVCYANNENKVLSKGERELNSYNSRSAYLIDYNTDTVLFERNADAKYPIASMVKIMTLNIVFDEIERGNLSFDEKIVISENASGMGGSQMFLDTGLEYTVSDLIKGITVVSANDASVALAEKIAGSVDHFIDLMNDKAKEYEMHDTCFVNVTGLPQEGQFSTAKDVSKMMKNLLKHAEYYNYSQIYLENFTHPDGRTTTLTNTNKLVRFYKGCDGGKTGFTNDAMFCLSATALKKDTRVIATVLGAPSSKERNKEITDLFNFAFTNYSTTKILEKDKPITAELAIKGAKNKEAPLTVDKDICALTKKGNVQDYEVVFDIQENLKAPLHKGQTIGKVRIVGTQTKNIIGEANLILTDDVECKSFLDGLMNIRDNWFIKGKVDNR